MDLSISSVSQVLALMSDLPGPDGQAARSWAARDPRLTKPAGALGRLEEISQWLSCWQGRHPPRLDHVRARIFAGNHGVAARGVSAFPSEVTAQMVANFQAGGAAINQLCRTFDVELGVISLDIDRPTQDFTQQAAMDSVDFLAAFGAGMAAVPDQTDLLVVGEMGIGNTTAAAAIPCALYGGTGADWVGRGTGIDDHRLGLKAQVIDQGVALHGGKAPLDLLAALGGRELAAMAGAVLAARLRRVPVLLDGYVCTAAVAPLQAINPAALDHCLVAHASAEPGHARLLHRLNKKPLLDMAMRLGEGSGAALAVGLVRAALACHTGMATFDQAGVSEES